MNEDESAEQRIRQCEHWQEKEKMFPEHRFEHLVLNPRRKLTICTIWFSTNQGRNFVMCKEIIRVYPYVEKIEENKGDFVGEIQG
mmetsp:Transcript_4603/g.17388  ORF Transcript_4603/g.17388 Transcript_4603/m.17388 type:complete len:85 (+) Transcript_4603:2308-2562(+)